MPFEAEVELLRVFLKRREDIIESIEGVLNAQRKPVAYQQDRSRIAQHFEDCFFAGGVVAASQAGLRGQLEEAHWAAGFKPRPVQHVYNDLIHPAEIIIRGFHCWQQTRWPGINGRMHFAQVLFSLYLVRCLALLSMRIWDEDPGGAAARLGVIQKLLDELWSSSPADQPVFVRDARWLIPLAQSLITDELAPYLEVSRRVAETLPKEDIREIRRAEVRMLGGHLVSQIRHYSTRDGVPIDDHSVVIRTRSSNALDFALLVQGLVELLRAYEDALGSGDDRLRIEMAGAICHGISPDPELFLNRVDLVGAYSMIEHVFIGRDREGRIAYANAGERHVALMKDYGASIERLRGLLHEDVRRFRPVAGGYSPYGVMFGIPSNLIEHMALKSIERDAETRFSLEDVFDDADRTDRETSAAKLAWVNGWRQLPHIDPEVQRRYEYPQQFAEEIYARTERELGKPATARPQTGRLYVTCSDETQVPELPARHFVSSDKKIVAVQKAEACETAQLLRDRQEGHFLVSYETTGGWIAVKKNLLTDVLGAGRDARVGGLPSDAAEVLRLMCVGLARC